MSLLSKDLAFVHIAKNAGRSVSAALKNNGHYNEMNWPNFNGSGHATSYEMDLANFDGFKFAILRNPIDRFFSAYHACFNDDEYNSIDECLDMTIQWSKARLWKRGVWNFSKHACVDTKGGPIYPRVPRAQFVPQCFYYDDSIELYDINNLVKLKEAYYNYFGTKLEFGHIKDSNYTVPSLTESQLQKIKQIYKEDFIAYEKISMLQPLG